VTLERLAHTAVGSRVVVRYLIEDGARATDVVGTLTARTATTITVLTARSSVAIPIGKIVAGKPVPPPPPRRHR